MKVLFKLLLFMRR